MPAQEAAPTAAERRAARRANQTTFNLILALAASLLIVVALVAVVIRPSQPQAGVDFGIDYRASAADAQSAFDGELAVPELPDTWKANRAEATLDSADGVDRFDVGFVTPDGRFLEVTQGREANDSWIADQVADARATTTATIGGVTWDVYDRRAASDPGNVAYALVATSGDVTIVVSGTADDAEFDQLATAVAKELR
jgi:hypothetical protein